MKVLICEDDFMTRKAVEHHLKRNGFDIETTQNGREAIFKMESNSFDLLLVDIHMPYMNGIELINYVRTKIKSTVPIVVLSRIGMEETMQEAFSVGANDYITKPFNPDELTQRLKRLIISNEKP